MSITRVLEIRGADEMPLDLSAPHVSLSSNDRSDVVEMGLSNANFVQSIPNDPQSGYVRFYLEDSVLIYKHVEPLGQKRT